MELPAAFIRRITTTFEPHGAPWLAALPELLGACAARWRLAIAPPFPELSYNYVAPASLSDGTPVVLKLGVPRAELGTEIDALRHYGGAGAVRLLDADEGVGALLLERLVPGETLVAMSQADDDAATAIAAEVIGRLWRPPPPHHRYPAVADWFAGLTELRPHFGGGTGPFPADLVARAEAIAAELLATAGPPMVLHGDLQHFNILATEEGWRAIDPKGLIGEPAFDLAALLRNPYPQLSGHPRLGPLLTRRINILSAALGLDRRRVHGWALAYAVLSAWWAVEDGPTEYLPDLTIARAFATIDPTTTGV